MKDAKLRAWWFAPSGTRRLAPRKGARRDPGAVRLVAIGRRRAVRTSRSFRAGGTEPRGRRRGGRRSLEIHELPTARGCTYVVPASDFALGLTVGREFNERHEAGDEARRHREGDRQAVRRRS